MTGDRPDGGPDYSELLRSPYDEPERPPEGESDLPWVPAVVAACLGAVLVGAFVVFAVVTGPDGEEEQAADTTSTTSTTVAPVASEQPPDGFLLLTEEVAGAAIATQVTPRGAIVTVATAVPGSSDPGAVRPAEVAYWELETDGGTVTMIEQSVAKIGVGNIVVTFPLPASLGEPNLIPHVAVVTTDEVSIVSFDTTLPRVVDPFPIEAAGVVITVEELSFDESWGWLAWSSDVPVRIDPTITFVGTDDPSTPDEDPTSLVPLSRQPFAFSMPTRPLPTPYGLDGAESLVRAGEPIAGDNQPTSVIVELAITVPTVIEEAERLPVAPPVP